MQVVILAGGFGTRLAEETITLPKPMVSIGEEPILVHLMRFYASQGHCNFVIALGYKGNAIKEYFRNFAQNSSNLRIETKDSKIKLMDQRSDNWTIDLIDTGLKTATGGRISRLADYLDDEFLMTYGDGLSDVNLNSLINFHKGAKTLATVTAVKPPARFGALAFNGDFVNEFSEKSKENVAWINGGFFMLNKKILDYIDSDETAFEPYIFKGHKKVLILSVLNNILLSISAPNILELGKNSFQPYREAPGLPFTPILLCIFALVVPIPNSNILNGLSLISLNIL